MSDSLEVLAPCGGPESIPAAIYSGADAVYLGAEKFSARRGAVNFTDEDLKAAVLECHRNGVLVYLAINTVIFEDELKDVADLLRLACSLRIDGLIIQDMAIYEMAKAACPDMPLHASTQMTLHTKSGAEAASELGFSRVVCARELPLKTIKEMCEAPIEVEAFVHGALCMCVSGQCYLSAAMGGRSANRGMCAGACRLPFSAKSRPADKYALSLKDLSYCRHVRELADAGVKSLKIEGRMKRPEYVAAATDAVKRAINGENYDENLLRFVFSRSGFTDGYLYDTPNASMFGARQKEDVVSAADVLPKIRKIYDKPLKRFELEMSLRAHPGEPLELTARCGGIEISLKSDPPEPAMTRETTPNEAEEQLKKLGGTPYECKKIEIDLARGLMLKKSELNGLRRHALEELDKKRVGSYPERQFSPENLRLDFPMTLNLRHPRLRVRVETAEQLRFLPDDMEEFVIPLGEAERLLDLPRDPEKAVLMLPRFDVDENRTVNLLKSAKNRGFKMAECGNLGQIRLVRSLGMVPLGGFGLNITNSLAARHYFFTENLEKLVLSPELSPSRAGCIATPAKCGMTVYGRLPLMITRNCPIRAEVGCGACKRRLIDRTDTEFPILCHKNIGVYELLNSRPIWLADKIREINLDFADLMFTIETPEECRSIYNAFLNESPPNGLFTRGLKLQ